MRCASCVVCWLSFAFQAVEGKFQAGSAIFGGRDPDHHWQYLGKFGYGLGTGSYDVRIRLQQPHSGQGRGGEDAEVEVAIPGSVGGRIAYLDFDVFLDEDWPSVVALPACQRGSAGRARRSHTLELRRDGEWSWWEGSLLTQSVRPHIWYFAVSDCRGELGNTTHAIDFELRMRQFDGSEFSIEVRRMLSANGLALIGFGVFIVRYAMRCQDFARSAGKLHPVIQVLTVAIAMQGSAQAFDALHLWQYRDDGVGFQVFDALSEVLLMLSQVVQTTLLIVIALVKRSLTEKPELHEGYTLMCSLGGELELPVKTLTALVLTIHAVLVVFAKLQGEASHKHHENEGVVGWLLLAIRLLLFAGFARAVRASQQRGGCRLRAFLQRFLLAGSIYLLAFPVLFAVVQVFAPYLQHPILQIGLLASQTASHVWLSDLFLSRGAYFQVSTLGWSLLPGGAGE